MRKIHGWAVIRNRGCWLGSKNATPVIRSPRCPLTRYNQELKKWKVEFQVLETLLELKNPPTITKAKDRRQKMNHCVRLSVRSVEANRRRSGFRAKVKRSEASFDKRRRSRKTKLIRNFERPKKKIRDRKVSQPISKFSVPTRTRNIFFSYHLKFIFERNTFNSPVIFCLNLHLSLCLYMSKHLSYSLSQSFSLSQLSLSQYHSIL